MYPARQTVDPLAKLLRMKPPAPQANEDATGVDNESGTQVPNPRPESSLGMLVPDTGDRISRGLAEEAPDLLAPSPWTASGTDQQEKLQKFRDYLGMRSPEFKAQQENVAAIDRERSGALAERDPVIKAARDQALKDKLALAGEPNRVRGEEDIALERVKAANAASQEEKRAERTRGLLETLGTSGRPFKPTISGKGDVTFSPDPLDQQSQRSITALREGSGLVSDLEASLGDPKGNVGNALANHLAFALYKAGVSPNFLSSYIPGMAPNVQKRLQVAGLLRVIGAAPYSAGSRNFQFLQQAQEHLTNPGASDAFLSQQIQELKRLYPRLYNDILTARYAPGTPLDFGEQPGEDDMTNPDRGR